MLYAAGLRARWDRGRTGHASTSSYNRAQFAAQLASRKRWYLILIIASLAQDRAGARDGW